jgi:crotonobetainyl-CoA:carnitine CoA-transferase CaiB-like acyl-CoA transferase
VDLLGNPGWSRNASFCGTRVDRRRNWFELQACMSEWTQTLPPEEVARRAQSVSVACFPVSTLSELLRNAQLQHRRFFDRLVSRAGAEASVPGLPFRIEADGEEVLPRARTRQTLDLSAVVATAISEVSGRWTQ